MSWKTEKICASNRLDILFILLFYFDSSQSNNSNNKKTSIKHNIIFINLNLNIIDTTNYNNHYDFEIQKKIWSF